MKCEKWDYIGAGFIGCLCIILIFITGVAVGDFQGKEKREAFERLVYSGETIYKDMRFYRCEMFKDLRK